MLGEGSCQETANSRTIRSGPSLEASVGSVRQLGVVDHDELKPVRWNLGGPSLVVSLALFPARHARDGQLVGLVEVRHRRGVLPLVILDDQAEAP